MKCTGLTPVKSRIVAGRFFTGFLPIKAKVWTGQSGPVEKVRPAGPVWSEKVRPVPTLGGTDSAMFNNAE